MPSDIDPNSASEQRAPADLSARLELFCGDSYPAEARVYARLPSDAPLEGWQITGRLIGPECRFAKTLPATIPFIDRGPGNGLLAEATVADPCFWTPELPFLYRAKIEVNSSRSVVRPVITAAFGSEVQARRERDEYALDRLFGIRRLGTIGRSLYLDGKRWVPRGVCRDHATDADLLAARDAAAALLLPAPDDGFCESASRLGVPLLVHVDASLRDATSESRRDSSTCRPPLPSEIRRLAQWPAVIAIILDSATTLSDEIRAAARNTLLATELTAQQSTVPAWAQLAMADMRPPDKSLPSHSSMPIPIIAARRLPHAESIAAARAACDHLQFDLAPLGDFAGYFV